MRQNNAAPPENKNEEPEIKPNLNLYLDAFFELDSERTHGEGLSPIPSSAIRAYAKDYGFSELQFYKLKYLIREMDKAHLKMLAKKMKEETKVGNNIKKTGIQPRKPNRPVRRRG